MPWPKGKRRTDDMERKRVATLRSNGKRHKKPNSDGHWRCCTCKKWKDSSAFYHDRRTVNGLKAQCMKCHSITAISSRDPEVTRAAGRRNEAQRRARKFQARGEVGRGPLSELEALFGNECLRCGATDNLQWDHVVPLSKGGFHCVSNLQRLCRKCNEKKQARTEEYRSKEQLLWVVKFKEI